MKSTYFCFILIILAGFVVGCERTGYVIIIKTENIKYDDLQQIGRMLKDKGFKTVVWEGKNDMQKYPNEVYSLFEKKVSGKYYHFVDVNLNYIKDVPNSAARNLRIDVHNIYKGETVAELKNEIETIGNLVYQEVVGKVGKENVSMERKEAQHRIIFF